MKKLFIPLGSSPYRQAAVAAANRVGIEVVGVSTAPYSMPLSSESALALSKLPKQYFMSELVHNSICNTTERYKVLPSQISVEISSAADYSTFTGPVYIKPKWNFRKLDRVAECYKRHDSISVLLNSQDYLNILEYNSYVTELEKLVVTEAIDEPVTILQVDISVNEFSEIYNFRTQQETFIQANKSNLNTTVDSTPLEILTVLSNFCKNYQVRGGLHTVQFAYRIGRWEVMDWNVRLGYIHYSAGLYPQVMDTALLHLVNEPYTHKPSFMEIRPYWDRPLDNSYAKQVYDLGLIPSWLQNMQSITRVFGIGDTKEEVYAKFARYEELLNSVQNNL